MPMISKLPEPTMMWLRTFPLEEREFIVEDHIYWNGVFVCNSRSDCWYRHFIHPSIPILDIEDFCEKPTYFTGKIHWDPNKEFLNQPLNEAQVIELRECILDSYPEFYGENFADWLFENHVAFKGDFPPRVRDSNLLKILLEEIEKKLRPRKRKILARKKMIHQKKKNMDWVKRKICA